MTQKYKKKVRYEDDGEIFVALWSVIQDCFKVPYKTMKIYNLLLTKRYISEQGQPMCKDIQLKNEILYINFKMLLKLKEINKDVNKEMYVKYN